ncbi:unnamed protein product [Ascophyllum nodosum]
MTAEKLTASLEGRKIVALKRRGKQMWFLLDKPPHPLFHFGMTGSFSIKGQPRHKYVKFKVEGEWPPKFTKLELEMSNGTCLALTDPRRLARVRLREDPEASPPISSLGPDPITDPLTMEDFAAALTKPNAPIKAVLLDQERLVSGVGNWVADEVCYQACVHPAAKCNTLSPEQVAALHAKLLSVCEEACEKRADYTVFPQHWLFHHRWGKGKGSGGTPHTASGHRVQFDVVGGRTTAIVPAVQRMGLLHAGSSAGNTAPVAKGRRREAKGKSRATKTVKQEEHEVEEGGEGYDKGEGGDNDFSIEGAPAVATSTASPKNARGGRRGKALVSDKAVLESTSEPSTKEAKPNGKKPVSKVAPATVKSRAIKTGVAGRGKAKSVVKKTSPKSTAKSGQRTYSRIKKVEVNEASQSGRAKRNRGGEQDHKAESGSKQGSVKRPRSANSRNVVKREQSKGSAAGQVTATTKRGGTSRKIAGSAINS